VFKEIKKHPDKPDADVECANCPSHIDYSIKMEEKSMLKNEAIEKLESERNTINNAFGNMLFSQVKDMAKNDSDYKKIMQEDKKLSDLKQEFDKFASEHKDGNSAVITPDQAEDLIKKYYGFTDEDNALDMSQFL